MNTTQRRPLAWRFSIGALAAAALFAGGDSFADEAAPSANPHALIKTSMGDITVELFRDQTPMTVANFLGLANGTKEWKDAQGGVHRKPFFDGLTFHRVVAKFMIQGGCPLGNGSSGPGYAFPDEISAKSLGLDKMKVVQHTGRLGIRSQREFQFKVVRPLVQKMGFSLGTRLTPEQVQQVNERIKALTLEEAFTLMGYRYDNSLTSSQPKKGMLAMANSGPNTNGSQFFINLEDADYLAGRHTVFGKVVKGFEVVQKIGKVKVGAASRPVTPVKIVSIRSVSRPVEAAK